MKLQKLMHSEWLLGEIAAAPSIRSNNNVIPTPHYEMATDRPAPKPTKIVEIPDRDMIKERKTSKEPTKNTQKRRRYGHRSGRHGARTQERERERFFTIFMLGGLIFLYWRERGEWRTGPIWVWAGSHFRVWARSLAVLFYSLTTTSESVRATYSTHLSHHQVFFCI